MFIGLINVYLSPPADSPASGNGKWPYRYSRTPSSKCTRLYGHEADLSLLILNHLSNILVFHKYAVLVLYLSKYRCLVEHLSMHTHVHATIDPTQITLIVQGLTEVVIYKTVTQVCYKYVTYTTFERMPSSKTIYQPRFYIPCVARHTFSECSNLVFDLNYNRRPFISNDTKYRGE